MRILLIGDAPWLPTEDGQQLGELARRLRDDLHSVFFMPTKGMSTNVGGAFTKDGIEFLPVDGDSGNDIVKWHVLHTGADLVISRGDASRFDKFRGSEFRWIAWFPGRKATNTVLRHTRGVIVPTVYDENALLEYGMHSRVFKPAVLPAFRKGDHDTRYFRERHGIPEDAFLIVSVGPTDKNFPRLLKGFAEFHKRHNNARLYLHTDWDGPPNLSQWAATYGVPENAMTFPDPYNFHIGYPADVQAAMYAAANVVVNPSRRIMPVLESMTVGTPVIYQNIADFAELTEMTRGQLGAAIDPMTWQEGDPLLDEVAMVNELEAAYSMSPEAMSNHRACCQMVANQYDWEKHYRDDWVPFLDGWKREIEAREDRLKYAMLDSKKLDTNMLLDLGDKVRKVQTGGSERDEKAMNAIIKALGPHPNIIEILEEGEDEFGRYYFDTPKYTPLTSMTNFTAGQGDRILADIKDAVDFLNSRGIAHRDLNAKNVLVRDDGSAVLFDFDWIQPGLTPEEAHLCDFEPLTERVRQYAVPVMQSNLATRGYHRVVAYVRNLNLDSSGATSHPDMPYQKVDGAGERDCGLRWDAFQPEVAGKRVLDLGCNLGYFGARALEEGASEVLCVDHDKAILAAAEKLHPELEGRTLRLELENERPEGDWDVAFCLSLWAHLGHGKRGLLDYLKTIPVVYWEDVTLSQPELEQMGFKVTRIGFSDLGRNLFKLESKRAAVAV